MNKLEIIKEYILKDRNRFSLALDIHDNFAKTMECLKDLIYSLLEKEIKKEMPKAKTNPYRLYTSNHYLDVIYNNDLKIQIEYCNYFKNPSLNVSKLNSENATMITNKIINSQFQNNHARVRVNLSNYNFNKISEVLELYDLYRDDSLQKELLNNFREHILPVTKNIFVIFDEFESG